MGVITEMTEIDYIYVYVELIADCEKFKSSELVNGASYLFSLILLFNSSFNIFFSIPNKNFK